MHDDSRGAVPYLFVRKGLEARLTRAVYYELVELGVEERRDGAPEYGVWSAGLFFPLGTLGAGLTAAEVRRRLVGPCLRRRPRRPADRPATRQRRERPPAPARRRRNVPAAVLVPLVDQPGGHDRAADAAHRPSRPSCRPDQLSRRADRGQTTPIRSRRRCAKPRKRSASIPSHIEVLGRLDGYVTITGFRGGAGGRSRPPARSNCGPIPFEVDEVFEVPLAFILDPANHQRHFRDGTGRQATAFLCAALWAALHLGRDRRHAGQPGRGPAADDVSETGDDGQGRAGRPAGPAGLAERAGDARRSGRADRRRRRDPLRRRLRARFGSAPAGARYRHRHPRSTRNGS